MMAMMGATPLAGVATEGAGESSSLPGRRVGAVKSSTNACVSNVSATIASKCSRVLNNVPHPHVAFGGELLLLCVHRELAAATRALLGHLDGIIAAVGNKGEKD
jgi:hypothetical protein